VLARATLCGKGTLENQRLHFPCTFFQAFAQYLLGTAVTLSTTGSNAEVVAECRHRCLPAIHRIPYFSFGNIVANANNHADTLLVSIRRKDKKQDKLLSNFL
jgi:hypothetical protein